MKENEYFLKQLRLISDVLGDAKLSLRKNPDTIAYKSCLKIYSDAMCAETLIETAQKSVVLNDMLYIFSKTFLWCLIYCNNICDDPTKHKVWLLSNQMRKRTRKLIQIIKSKSCSDSFSEDDYDEYDYMEDDIDPHLMKFLYDIYLFINNFSLYFFMGRI